MNFLPFLYEKLHEKVSLNNKHIYGMYSEYFILNLNRERFNLSHPAHLLLGNSHRFELIW